METFRYGVHMTRSHSVTFSATSKDRTKFVLSATITREHYGWHAYYSVVEHRDGFTFTSPVFQTSTEYGYDSQPRRKMLQRLIGIVEDKAWEHDLDVAERQMARFVR